MAVVLSAGRKLVSVPQLPLSVRLSRVFTGMDFAQTKDKGILLNCTVQPNAKTSKVVSLDSSVHISISSPAQDNKANKELLSFLQEVLGKRKSDLSLVKGLKSREKVVFVDGIDVQTAQQLLRQQLS